MKYLVIGGYSITLEIDDFGCVNSDIFVSTYMTRTIYENEYYKRNIGMVFDGVLEKRNDNECYVLTSNYISVLLNDDYNNNEILSVKIDRVIDDNVYGIVER